MKDAIKCQRVINRLTAMQRDVSDVLPLLGERFHRRLRKHWALYATLIKGLEKQRKEDRP